MSLPSKKTIACPKCNASFTTTIFDSVNTDYDKELAKKIISGEFFDAKCPKCGFVAHLEYDVLYHDLKRQVMVFVAHKENKKYESRIAEMRSTFMLPGYKTRIVHNMLELREKVAALEMNRDDREIELCKYYIRIEAMRQNPDFNAVRAFYACIDNREVVFVYDENDAHVGCDLNNDIFAMIQKVFGASLAAMPEERYPIYDAAWAEHLWATQDIDVLDDEDSFCDTGECTEDFDQGNNQFKEVLRSAFGALMEETESFSCGNGIYAYQIETKTGFLEVRIAYEDIEQALEDEHLEVFRGQFAADAMNALIKMRIQYLIALHNTEPENYAGYESEQHIIKDQQAFSASLNDKVRFNQMADEAGMPPAEYENRIIIGLALAASFYPQKIQKQNHQKPKTAMQQKSACERIHFESFEAFLGAYRKN